jgi:hypothetical protein
MSNNSRNDFHKRLAALDKKQPTETRAKRTDRAGIYDYDEESRRKSRKFPIRKLMVWIVIGIVGLIAVKAYTVANMGEEQYQIRLAELKEGDQYQRIAAILISRDPLMIFFEKTVFADNIKKIDEVETENASGEEPQASESTAAQ